MATLTGVLKKFMREKKRTLGKLAELTQQVDARAEKQNVAMKFRGVPKRTLGHWYNGDAKRPRAWEELVLVATALDLNETETNELLLSAKHRALAELRANETRADRLALLARWDSDAPFQLGPDLKFFAGRKMELAKLEDALLKQRAVTICGLRGMGGVGKTTLARHLAYRLQNQFPDGVLWGQLNRSDTLTILAQFAREYKLDVSAYRDVESRSRAVQSLLANKRVLIILDNAQTSDQVRPLLPPSTGKPAVMLTTRHDLAVSDEMTLFELRPFARDGQEALELFTNILDEQTVRREPRALLELAAALGYLPLALAIAANRLKQSPVGSKRERAVNEFLVRVRGNVSSAAARLDELTREDLSVRVTFDSSFAELSDTQQEFFIALGAFSGDDFDVSAAAYVAQASVEQAKQFLNDLVSLSLVEIAREGRYALHRLMRDYAREKMVGMSEYARMFEHYVELQHSKDQQKVILVAYEVDNIVAALRYALEREMLEWVLWGGRICSETLYAMGFVALAEQLWRFALERSDPNDKAQQYLIHLFLGRTLYLKVALPQAHEHYQLALALARAEGDKKAIVDALRGVLLTKKDVNASSTLAEYEEAIQLAQAIGYDEMTCVLLNNLGVMYSRRDLAHATELFEQGLALAVKIDDRGTRMRLYGNLCAMWYWRGDLTRTDSYSAELGEWVEKTQAQYALIEYLNHAGNVALLRGHVDEAKSFYQRCLDVSERVGRLGERVMALVGLAKTAWKAGEMQQAENYFQRASLLANEQIFDEEALYLKRERADFNAAVGQYAKASELYEQVLKFSQMWGYQADTASALFGIARINLQRGELKAARGAAFGSLELFQQLGHVRAVQVRAWLSELDGHSNPI